MVHITKFDLYNFRVIALWLNKRKVTTVIILQYVSEILSYKKLLLCSVIIHVLCCFS